MPGAATAARTGVSLEATAEVDSAQAVEPSEGLSATTLESPLSSLHTR
jgi:hypothetical protein